MLTAAEPEVIRKHVRVALSSGGQLCGLATFTTRVRFSVLSPKEVPCTGHIDLEAGMRTQ
jgi:hypothetical protein